MAKVYRFSGYHQGKVNGNIEDVWALVTDWGSLAWYEDDTNPDHLKMMDSWLEGEPGSVPRTRVMSRGEGAVKNGGPEENREVLLVEDKVAHRLYYDATDDFVPGIRNYMATWAFDETDDGGCMMTISSNFDVIPAENGELYGATLQGVYVSIANSLNKYFTRAKAAKSAA